MLVTDPFAFQLGRSDRLNNVSRRGIEHSCSGKSAAGFMLVRPKDESQDDETRDREGEDIDNLLFLAPKVSVRFTGAHS